MPATSTVRPGDIWNALIGAGATPVQAAALMGNMQSESGLNPESAGLDTNGYWSYGLVSWNQKGYTNAAQLVTGNPAQDLANQIAFLKSTGGFDAAAGADPATAATNFAHNYERCAACGYQGGSGALVTRAKQAMAIFSAQGQIPGSSSSSSSSAVLTSAGVTSGAAFNPAAPVVQLDIPLLGNTTLVNAGQARTIKAFALIGAGSLLMIAGLGVLLASVGVTRANPVAQLAQAPVKAVGARQASNRRVRETRAKEEIRTEGAVTRSEARASASRYRRAPTSSESLEPF